MTKAKIHLQTFLLFIPGTFALFSIVWNGELRAENLDHLFVRRKVMFLLPSFLPSQGRSQDFQRGRFFIEKGKAGSERCLRRWVPR